MEIETREDVEFIGPPVNIVSCPAQRETCIVLEDRDTRESDEAATERFRMENPHLMQTEEEWFLKRDNECKKADEAGPSYVVKLESDDEVEPGDKSDVSDDIDWDNLWCL